MHLQAPTLSISHRAQALSALAALAVAGGAYGAITIATNDDQSTTSSQSPSVTKVDTSRVLDGSAVLRGTANRVDPSRVLDGSPLVRGLSAAPSVAIVTHPSLAGGQFLPKSGLPKNGDALPSALQPPKGQPEGFHGQ
jgi:hypothetical protein